MRFIIHEMAYEKPLTAGRWEYVQDGQATGAVEQWRLSEAVDGYRFLRVDLDARAATSGRSYLYHLTVDENGRAVQLKYRLWSASLEIAGTVLLEEDAVIITRKRGDERQEDVLNVPSSYGFWFPATAGLTLVSGIAVGKNIPAVTLNASTADPSSLMGPVSTKLEISDEGRQVVKIMGKEQDASKKIIKWQNQQRHLWLDDNGWPLMMKRDDGLTAVTTQLFVYQHITKPGVEPAQQHNVG